ncbi:MAG: 1,4-dihydroxy-2-naphthoate polyprenyltransferase, partial [Mycobacteriaceae bacterium]
LHLALLAVPLVASVLLTLSTPWALLGLAVIPLLVRAAAPVRRGALGLALVPALRDTGLAMLAWAALTALALALA